MEGWLILLAIVAFGFFLIAKDSSQAAKISAQSALSRLESVDQDCEKAYEEPMREVYERAAEAYNLSKDEALALLIKIGSNLDIMANSKYWDEDPDTYLPYIAPDIFKLRSVAESNRRPSETLHDDFANYFNGKYNISGMEQKIKMKKVSWLNKRIAKDKTLISNIVANTNVSDINSLIQEAEDGVNRASSEEIKHYASYRSYGGEEVDWFSSLYRV